MLGRRIERGHALGGKEGEERAQVARVGLDGVSGGAALGHEHVEEGATRLGRPRPLRLAWICPMDQVFPREGQCG